MTRYTEEENDFLECIDKQIYYLAKEYNITSLKRAYNLVYDYVLQRMVENKELIPVEEAMCDICFINKLQYPEVEVSCSLCPVIETNEELRKRLSILHFGVVNK